MGAAQGQGAEASVEKFFHFAQEAVAAEGTASVGVRSQGGDFRFIVGVFEQVFPVVVREEGFPCREVQHGTATVLLAALINGLKQTGRRPQETTAVILGAGAAGYAIARILVNFGLKDVVVYDSVGAIYRGRAKSMNPYKERLAEMTNKQNMQGPLAEGFKGKDIFVGVAKPNMVTKAMVASMAKNPLVFPLSNPIGEITVHEAYEAGAAIAADGRTINNALAYPGLFRGALAVESLWKLSTIYRQMLFQIVDHRVPERPDRNEPRTVRREQKHYPTLKITQKEWRLKRA